MKKNKITFKKSFVLSIYFVIAFALLTGILSCNEKGPVVSSIEKANFQCIQLSKIKIQDWVSNGWTTPGNANLITALQFTPSYDIQTGKDILVTAYAIKNMNDIIPNSGKQLDVDPACFSSLPAFSMGRNYFDLDSLKITDTEGMLTDFSFIRLTPYADTSSGGVLYFNLQVIIVSAINNSDSIVTQLIKNPCPPCQYCRPPNCAQ